jgi:hypothetical protein
MQTTYSIIKQKENFWECPKCNRRFQRQHQSHSCKIFPLEKHFEGKNGGKGLYEYLKHKLEKAIGIFTIQSLECCIHFDSNSTFAAIKILKDKIRVEFSLGYKVTNKRIVKVVQLSANQYLHYTIVTNNNEIDNELIEWIKKAYNNKETLL